MLNIEDVDEKWVDPKVKLMCTCYAMPDVQPTQAPAPSDCLASNLQTA